MSARQDLMKRAASSFQRAGDDFLREAADCFLQADEHAAAGWALKRAATIGGGLDNSLTRQAASAFERAERWSDAANCHELIGDALEAARCWKAGGDSARAAWAYADSVEDPGASRRCLDEAVAAGAGQNEAPRNLSASAPTEFLVIARDIVEARLEIRLAPRTSGKRLKAAVRGMVGYKERDSWRLNDARRWAGIVAKRLDRPDLAALVAATERSLEHSFIGPALGIDGADDDLEKAQEVVLTPGGLGDEQ